MILIDHWEPAPPTLPALACYGLHLWLIDLTHPSDKLSELLSPDETERARRIFNENGKYRFITARGTLRQILGNYLDTSPQEIRFHYGPSGKPELEPTNPLAFNLSHSAGLALLAVTRDTAIGIDLEPDRARPNARTIARRMFPQQILAAIDSLEDEAFHRAFLRHWTVLEARVKLEGGSLFRPPAKPCQVVHFQPRSKWLAAIAMGIDLPPYEQWSTFTLTPTKP